MHAQRGDHGVTLVELMAAIALAGILTATATWTFANYLRTTQHRDTGVEVRAALRSAAERALSEGRTYCIYFDAATGTYSTYRSDCTVAANKVATATTGASTVHFTAVAFTPPSAAVPNQTTACPKPKACAYFYPRGTAIPGVLDITRSSGGTKAYRITVEGLTSRVSLS